MRRKREQAIRDNPNIMVQRRSSESTLDEDFTLYELKQVLTGLRNTSPGKDDICNDKEFIRYIVEYNIKSV